MHIAHPFVWITLSVLACDGCTSCTGCQPQLPADVNNTDNAQPANEPDNTDDTGADTGDSGFEPPPCPIMEIEPNDSYAEGQLVVLEKWICGDFYKEFDLDNYGFVYPEEDGWLKLWARGQDIGSLSDLLITVNQDLNTAVSFAQMDSTDPLMIIPVTNADVIFATLQDQYGGYGENNFYEFLISQVKAPVEWNTEEQDDFGSNNSPAGANPIEDGTRLFGRTATNTDTDWYKFSTQAGVSTTIELSITAFQEGSPLDAIIYLYPEGAFSSSSTPYVAVRNNGTDVANNLDPILRYTTSQGGEWAVLIKNNASGGSDFHWYVLDVSITEAE